MKDSLTKRSPLHVIQVRQIPCPDLQNYWKGLCPRV